MYQGALTMCLSTLFWNRCTCVMSILLCLLQLQSWIPYVQTGFRICLYKKRLLWRDSEEFLPISQYTFLYLRSSSSRFFLIWAFHRSLASKVMPRYLAVLAYGTFWLLIVIGMCLKHLLVKLIWTDLDSLSWMCPEALKPLLIWSTSTWRADSGKGPKTNPEGTTVSHRTSYTQSFCYNFNIVHLEWYGSKLKS